MHDFSDAGPPVEAMAEVVPFPAQSGNGSALAVDIAARVAAGMARELPAPPGVALRFDLDDWDAAKAFVGPAPERRWLISYVAPVGTAGTLCSMGGVGKSYLLLELGFRVAYGSRPADLPILGGEVERHGNVVFLTAEEDKDEVHRRIEALDPTGERRARDSIVSWWCRWRRRAGRSP